MKVCVCVCVCDRVFEFAYESSYMCHSCVKLGVNLFPTKGSTNINIKIWCNHNLQSKQIHLTVENRINFLENCCLLLCAQVYPAQM